jgi:hypothetical protein
MFRPGRGSSLADFWTRNIVPWSAQDPALHSQTFAWNRWKTVNPAYLAAYIPKYPHFEVEKPSKGQSSWSASAKLYIHTLFWELLCKRTAKQSDQELRHLPFILAMLLPKCDLIWESCYNPFEVRQKLVPNLQVSIRHKCSSTKAVIIQFLLPKWRL